MADEIQKYCELGAQNLEQGKPEEALQWYGRALELDPDFADAWCGRAKAYFDLGRLERADRDFRRALVCAKRVLEDDKSPRTRRWWVDPETRPYLRALHGKGLCRFWRSRHEDAIRVFKRLLRLVPGDPLDVRFLLGETYFRMGDVDHAVREWRQVGDDPDALYNLGLAYFFRGEFVRSVNTFRRAIFENLFLVARLTDAKIVSDVPRYAGAHYKGLDCEDAAGDYLDRCGDLWDGRPLLTRWLRAIYEHPVVTADVSRHVRHLRSLVRDDLTPGNRARLEGENTALRGESRLAQTDREVAQSLCEQLFRVED